VNISGVTKAEKSRVESSRTLLTSPMSARDAIDCSELVKRKKVFSRKICLTKGKTADGQCADLERRGGSRKMFAVTGGLVGERFYLWARARGALRDQNLSDIREGDRVSCRVLQRHNTQDW
jgi:hypothetical protein